LTKKEEQGPTVKWEGIQRIQESRKSEKPLKLEELWKGEGKSKVRTTSANPILPNLGPKAQQGIISAESPRH